MLGAVVGDVIGSIYEISNIKSKDFKLFDIGCRYTDDSVMTCAIANACISYVENKDKELFRVNVIKNMKFLGTKYINAGYGATFIKWLISSYSFPYNSWGNGSAMRVSPVAWISEDLEECESLAEISASVTHNHSEGIKGAKAIATCVFLAKSGHSKEDIENFISKKYYNLDFCLDDIRDNYQFDVSCQGSVPQAIKAFLESNDFEDAIRNAISLGGDSDTIAAMTGCIAEAFYGIPENIIDQTKKRLPDDLLYILRSFNDLRKKNNLKK